MRVNFLEELVAEWYEYEGHFVRRNVLVGKGPKGGHEGELDVVAFHPKTKHLVHIEPSYDSHSWESREDSYTKKFAAGRKYIPGMFSEILPDAAPDQIEQIALIAYIGKDRPFAGGTAKSLRAFLKEIVGKLSQLTTTEVPQQFALLRALSYAVEYRKELFKERPKPPES